MKIGFKFAFLSFSILLTGCVGGSINPVTFGFSSGNMYNAGVQDAIHDRRSEVCPNINVSKTQQGVEAIRSQVESTHPYYKDYSDGYDYIMSLSVSEIRDSFLLERRRVSLESHCQGVEDTLIKAGNH